MSKSSQKITQEKVYFCAEMDINQYTKTIPLYKNIRWNVQNLYINWKQFFAR